MRMEERRVEGSVVLALLVSSLVLCASFGRVGAADESGLANECSKDFQSVMTCLSFAQGKVATPTKECCSSVSSIKESEPKCLCYILQQTQTSGAQNLKSLGVQETKLLQLPSACQLKNASVSYCPKLLGLSPNSPDAAIFTNISSPTATTPASVSAGTPSSASEKSDSKSSGTKLGIHLVGSTTLLVASAIFFYAFPAGFASLL
ncbi:non-specific lipid transfer protein GPI-anchored 1-like [Durio zibethinus]|uniref:Non-specific lipid transfer protein GPI-anchored 1-like n=1 Tax=Durio zibethinus TaxID=66656 RepID=A0A6P5XED4_DURZI|nr:non-specific lipid transfer protein GPI-anchored 1-like [Durio zibethinus]